MFRDAENPEVFLDAVARQLDWRIEIVSGEREAELTYADVAQTHGGGGPLALLDIGGGSSEIVAGQGGRIASRQSINIGSRRLTERVAPHEPWTADDLARARAAADDGIGEVAPLPGRLVGTGGTITCLAAVAAGMVPFDPAAISRITRRDADQRAGGAAGRRALGTTGGGARHGAAARRRDRRWRGAARTLAGGLVGRDGGGRLGRPALCPGAGGGERCLS